MANYFPAARDDGVMTPYEYKQNYITNIAKLEQAGTIQPTDSGWVHAPSGYFFPELPDDVLKIGGSKIAELQLNITKLRDGDSLRPTRRRVQKDSFEDWFAAEEFKPLTLQAHNRVVCEQYPELYVTIRNSHNINATRKQIDGLFAAIYDYHHILEALGAKGVLRQDKDDGVHLTQVDDAIDIKLAGDHKKVMKSVSALLNRLTKKVEPSNKPLSTVDASSIKPGASDTLVRVDQAEPLPRAPIASNETAAVVVDTQAPTPITYAIPNREMQPASERGYCAHDTPYNSGDIPAINSNSCVLVLDAGVIMRFFGISRKDQIETEPFKQAERFGEQVFSSIINTPNIDAIIIPDYVLDVELLDRITRYDDGNVSTHFLRDQYKPEGDYFNPRVEQFLRCAVRRHLDDDGRVSYLKDSEVPDNMVIPKIIIWESKTGKYAQQEFLREKEHYRNLSEKERKKAKKPGENKGEQVIEGLIKEHEFAECKKMVISTDNLYIRGDIMDLEERADTCRANLGHYLQSLIIGNVPYWSDISDYQPTQPQTNLAAAVMEIRMKMREIFNELVPKEKKDPGLPLTACDNHALFTEMTGLESVGKRPSQAAVVQAMKAQGVASSPSASR